ncbi:MAG: hypothetical protein CBC13_08595 [Planctomycetia bacterium TMED53]|nr:MAG: hypothetical protein CBC13_08595 [Planctomycetia bacterium TMED53]
MLVLSFGEYKAPIFDGIPRRDPQANTDHRVCNFGSEFGSTEWKLGGGESFEAACQKWHSWLPNVNFIALRWSIGDWLLSYFWFLGGNFRVIL